MDKKKADQTASHNTFTSHPTSDSGSAQRRRLLNWMRSNGPIDTLTARSELNILMPAARIKELKDRGHPIYTQRISATDDQGRTHHGVAQYVLLREVVE